MADVVHENVLRCRPVHLIPTYADSKKEERATSIILFALMNADAFAARAFGSVGRRVGKTAKVECVAEVEFREDRSAEGNRPDGLVVITVGSRKWCALIEAKIDGNDIDPSQVERYIRLAKSNGIDALITISNQFATRPDHVPYDVSGIVRRNFEVFHWSWSYLLTEAMLVAGEPGNDAGPLQRTILREVVHYFLDKSSGLRRKTQMNPEWREVVSVVTNGGQLSRRSPEVGNTVRHWHEELKDLALILSDHLSTLVSVRMTRAHASDPGARMQHDIAQLGDQLELKGEIDVPNAAAPLALTANLSRRSITCSMTISAPDDRKRSASRLNWLLRQLPDDLPESVMVSVRWPRRTPSASVPVQNLREDLAVVLTGDPKILPVGFDVQMTIAHGSTFSGPKTFIEALEKLAVGFYDNVGQHLRKWQAPPPRPARETSASLPAGVTGPAVEVDDGEDDDDGDVAEPGSSSSEPGPGAC